MGVSICLDVVLIETLDPNTEKKLASTIKILQSRLRNLDFVSTPPSSTKNFDREKKKVGLDRRENLNNEKKLVSTPRTFSISISIGLNCRDHHAE